MRCSGACWRGSSKRCGARSIRRHRIDLIELGPGRGLFARDVLDWSAKQFPEFARRAALLAGRAVGASARASCRATGRAHCGREVRRSSRRSRDAAACGSRRKLIVFGNEFFDALPVEVIDHRGAVRVGVEGGDSPSSSSRPRPRSSNSSTATAFIPKKASASRCRWRRWRGWIALPTCFRGRRGFAVLIDYGYTREEQLAGRHRDTIMTYRQHVASASPYEAPGEQDITAHVNFTALRARGGRARAASRWRCSRNRSS